MKNLFKPQKHHYQTFTVIAGIGVSVSSSSHAPASVCYSPNAYTFRYSSSSQITLSCRQTLVGNFVVFDGVTLGHLISVVSSIKVTVTALSGGGGFGFLCYNFLL